jgi:hypothetical protein
VVLQEVVGHLEHQVLQVLLDQVEHLVQVDRLDHQVLQVVVVHRVQEVHQEPQVLQVLREQVEHQVQMVQEV